ncbi:MAG TPA: adenine deaminase [Chthoniobacterales bacterium]
METADRRVISGQLVDLHRRTIFPAEIEIAAGRIADIREVAEAPRRYLLPGFVDAHVHIESSMLPPAEFARLAVVHGTVATVSDPHEIANVLGVAGIDFMLANAAESPFKFCFGAPPCVPATTFETAGATLGLSEVTELLARPGIGYLSEVMNWPGVLGGDPELLGKIAAAKAVGKPVDGHAPGLRGEDAARYAAAGIETDHECYSLPEALDKIAAGMWISIREGSAARNFAALEPLLRTHPAHCMLCTDDLHPNALVRGHLDRIVARAVAGGADVFDVLRCACVHPVLHYRLPVGLLRAGDPADFIVVEDLTDFRVTETWLDGVCVASGGASHLATIPVEAVNRFVATPVVAEDFARAESGLVNVIVAQDGELITGHDVAAVDAPDVLKIAVVNRYAAAPPAVGYIRGFGLTRGAIASSVAHDSHNIVAVGASDAALAAAVNAVIAARGGVAATDGEGTSRVLPLEIAGLMSTLPGEEVAARYEEVAAFARELGSSLRDPFMTLSFMALLVIPDLKMSDLGLFSGRKFEFVDVATSA